MKILGENPSYPKHPKEMNWNKKLYNNDDIFLHFLVVP